MAIGAGVPGVTLALSGPQSGAQGPFRRPPRSRGLGRLSPHLRPVSCSLFAPLRRRRCPGGGAMGTARCPLRWWARRVRWPGYDLRGVRGRWAWVLQCGLHCWARYALGAGQGCAGRISQQWPTLLLAGPGGRALPRAGAGHPWRWGVGPTEAPRPGRTVRACGGCGAGGVRASGHTPPPPSVAQGCPAPATACKRAKLGRLGGHCRPRMVVITPLFNSVVVGLLPRTEQRDL